MDKLIFSLGVTGLGMAVVFAGLILLIAFIGILSKMTSSGGSKKKDEPKSGAAKPLAKAGKSEVPDDVMAAITAALAAYDETPSPEVVAAIAAALNVVMGEGNFVVKHVRRVRNAPAWNRAGREEQIYSRF